jgi:hypothetical protein
MAILHNHLHLYSRHILPLIGILLLRNGSALVSSSGEPRNQDMKHWIAWLDEVNTAGEVRAVLIKTAEEWFKQEKNAQQPAPSEEPKPEDFDSDPEDEENPAADQHSDSSASDSEQEDNDLAPAPDPSLQVEPEEDPDDEQQAGISTKIILKENSGHRLELIINWLVKRCAVLCSSSSESCILLANVYLLIQFQIQ